MEAPRGPRRTRGAVTGSTSWPYLRSATASGSASPAVGRRAALVRFFLEAVEPKVHVRLVRLSEGVEGGLALGDIAGVEVGDALIRDGVLPAVLEDLGKFIVPARGGTCDAADAASTRVPRPSFPSIAIERQPALMVSDGCDNCEHLMFLFSDSEEAQRRLSGSAAFSRSTTLSAHVLHSLSLVHLTSCRATKMKPPAKAAAMQNMMNSERQKPR